MQSLLDVIVSVIIAGMLTISMFTALLAMQAQAFNSQIYMNMENNTSKIIEIIKNYYLGSVGVKSSGAPITTATSKKFRFNTFIDPGTGTPTSTDVTIEERTIAGKKSIWIYRNNSYAQKLFGPFDLSPDGLDFEYYDIDGNRTTTPSDITSVRMIINFAREGLNYKNNTPTFITNHIVIWKYFERLYY